MKIPYRRILAAFFLVCVAAYGAAVFYMNANETKFVFVAHGRPTLSITNDALVPWDTLRVEASDSVPVFLLKCPIGQDSHLWAIYLHGTGGQVGDRGTADRVELLRSVGFNVLAVEYRGYGHSGTQVPNEPGLYADARAAWDYLVQDLGVDEAHILIYGFSLGGMVATHLASEVTPRALVTEGTATSAPDLGKLWYPWLPASWILENRFDNLARAPSLSSPWLLLHGESDESVPIGHADLLAAASQKGEVVRLTGGHPAATEDWDRAQSALQRFVDANFVHED